VSQADDVQALTVRLPRDVHRELRVRSIMERRSSAAIITDLVRAYLAQHSAPAQPQHPSAPAQPQQAGEKAAT